MIDLEITNNNLFMQSLLRGDTFDDFEVREIKLHTLVRLNIDGKRNKDYTKEDTNTNASDYIKWSEIKPHVFNLIKGDVSPSYFQIVLSTTNEYSQKISENISAFFLNIHYKENVIKCTTGAAHETFSLDKTHENIWDEEVKKFLISNKLV